MYLGRGEVLPLLVLAVGGGRGEVPGGQVSLLLRYGCIRWLEDVPFGDSGLLLCILRHRSKVKVWCLRFRARWTQNTSKMTRRTRPTAPATVPPIRAAVGCHVSESWDVARLA